MNQFLALITVVLLTLPLSSSADQDAGLRMMLVSGEAQAQNIDPLCHAKALVAQYAYTYRDKQPVDAALKMIEDEWALHREDGGRWIDFDYATYVDMQRIIRDAYRKSGGKFRRECCTKEAIIEQMRKAYWSCKRQGF